MDNQRHRLRATGDYATYHGCEYFADKVWSRVWLFTDDDPPDIGFEPSPKDWVKYEKLVPLTDVERLFRSRTTCVWRGYPFEVGIIVGESANVTYLGVEFDEVCRLPGMRRPDRFEVQGRAPVSELSQLEQHLEEVRQHADAPSGNEKRGNK